MSWLDGMVEDNEAASQDQRLERTNTPPAPGFFRGAGSALFVGMGQGLGQLALQAAQYGNDPTQIISLDIPTDEEEIERREAIGKQRRDFSESMKPDPATVGTAGQILFGLGDVGTRFAFGLASGGPLVGAGTVGTSVGEETFSDLRAKGVDTGTALAVGAVQGAATAVGAVLPAARLVKPLVGDAALTMGANVGLGVVSRGATGAILEENGYAAQAAQFKAFDKTAIATDAVLGAAFFGLGRLGGARVTPEQVDAALTERTAQHADIDTAPGAPITPQAAAAHQTALHTAMEQLSRGERVEVPPAIHDADFLRTKPEGTRPAELLQSEMRTADSRSAAGEFAGRVGRETEYDADGAPVFRDGTAYPLSDAMRFFEQHVEPTAPKDGTPMPDVLFSVGRVDDSTSQGLHDYLPGFHEGLREVRISGKSVKHIQDSRPTLVRDVLSKLERGALQADEVLPNPVNRTRALIVLHDAAQTASSKGKHLSHVVEVSANGSGVDIVTVMSARDGALKAARKLRDELAAEKQKGETLSGGATYPSSSLETGAPQSPHAAADFPTVAQDRGNSISKADDAASDPELQVVDEILARVDDIRIATGAVDAEGNPVTVSARELLADADADIQQAHQDSKGFAAAAACFLQRGD